MGVTETLENIISHKIMNRTIFERESKSSTFSRIDSLFKKLITFCNGAVRTEKIDDIQIIIETKTKILLDKY